MIVVVVVVAVVVAVVVVVVVVEGAEAWRDAGGLDVQCQRGGDWCFLIGVCEEAYGFGSCKEAG